MLNKYAFLDRDGALIYEPSKAETPKGEIPYQIDSIKKLKILPGVIEGLKNLINEGFKLILVSNQDYLGTEIFPESKFEKPQKRMLQIFKDNGIEFEKIFICPHGPSANCPCRKPKTGIVKKLLKNNKPDLKNSFMYGDRKSDEQFAVNLGIKFIKAETNGEFNLQNIMKKRISKKARNTKETRIGVAINLDGTGKYNIKTGIGFLDHMLELFSKHSLIDLKITAKGDLKVDEHHTVEDVGIALGQALKEALGDKKGIRRYGFLLPMDECLAEIALDLGGRPYLVWNVIFKREYVGDMPTELFEDFFKAISDNIQANIHVNLKYGRNEHHMAEAIFKAFAKSLRFAVDEDPRAKNLLPSTKGRL